MNAAILLLTPLCLRVVGNRKILSLPITAIHYALFHARPPNPKTKSEQTFHYTFPRLHNASDQLTMLFYNARAK